MRRTVICEYVGFGHPDKVADQISDTLLDAFLEKDPNTRAGIEVMVKDNIVVLGGEVKSTAQIDYDHIVRETMDNVCYPDDTISRETTSRSSTSSGNSHWKSAEAWTRTTASSERETRASVWDSPPTRQMT